MIACVCFQVSEDQIKNELQNNSHSLATLKHKLNVAAGCGCCAEYIEEMINQDSIEK